MKKISLAKILFFLLIVLPLTVFVFGFVIIPLVIVLLICSLFWSGKVFRIGTFRRSDKSSDGYWERGNVQDKGDYVDVESTVVASSVTGKDENGSGMETPHILPEKKEK